MSAAAWWGLWLVPLGGLAIGIAVGVLAVYALLALAQDLWGD